MGERVSGEAGHLHVDEHGVGRSCLCVESFERSFSAFEGFDLEAGLGGQEADHLSAHHIVIDH